MFQVASSTAGATCFSGELAAMAASRRARIALQQTGLISPDEDRIVGKVLHAAALTYVAATLTSVLTLLYYLFRSGLLGGGSRRDD